jgi:hypothetical protein
LGKVAENRSVCLSCLIWPAIVRIYWNHTEDRTHRLETGGRRQETGKCRVKRGGYLVPCILFLVSRFSLRLSHRLSRQLSVVSCLLFDSGVIFLCCVYLICQAQLQ